PALYETLRDRPERGAVCELPLGVRDGLGMRGAFNDRVLFFQTIHGRPLVGGFVARLPRTVAAAYQEDGLLSSLWRLAGPTPAASADALTPLPSRELAGARLRIDGISFIVLDRKAASPALTSYVQNVLPLAFVADDGERALYVVSR